MTDDLGGNGGRADDVLALEAAALLFLMSTTPICGKGKAIDDGKTRFIDCVKKTAYIVGENMLTFTLQDTCTPKSQCIIHGHMLSLISIKNN